MGKRRSTNRCIRIGFLAIAWGLLLLGSLLSPTMTEATTAPTPPTNTITPPMIAEQSSASVAKSTPNDCSSSEAVKANSCSSSHSRPSPLQIMVLVEPSPFTYISGYANRFQALCRYLVESFNDHVQVVTAEVVHSQPPTVWSIDGHDNHKAKNTASTTTPSSSTTTTAPPHHPHKSNRWVPIYYTHGIRCPGYPFLSLAMDWSFSIPRLLWQHRPDLIHVSSPGLLVWGAIVWSRWLNIPLVCSYHTHIPRYVHAYFPTWLSQPLEWVVWGLIRMGLACMDLTLVTSPQIQEEFHSHGITAEVWRKGIDTQRFSPNHFNASMRQRMLGHNVDDDATFLMLYVGRLSHEKRLQDLYPILKAMPHARLCLVGHGPQEEELRRYFADTNTIFMGQLQGDELSQTFASTDVFVMPSDSETLGFVVLESMASGVPVVGARAGGIPDLIRHDHNGYLVTPGNTTDFVRYLEQLEQNTTLRRNMGRQARNEMQQWSWQASVEYLRQVQYQKAMENFDQRWEQRLWRFLTRRKQVARSAAANEATSGLTIFNGGQNDKEYCEET